MIYSPWNKSLSIKTIDNRHTDKIPFCIVEKMIDTREPDGTHDKVLEDIDSPIRRISILDSEENNGNSISVCVAHRYGDRHICFPENIPNSETSPPAFCALVDVVAEREDLDLWT